MGSHRVRYDLATKQPQQIYNIWNMEWKSLAILKFQLSLKFRTIGGNLSIFSKELAVRYTHPGLINREELVQWLVPCLEAQEADPLKGIFRGRESFDFSACRDREQKRFGWSPLPFKSKSGNSKRMQCRNVVLVKSWICLLPDSWKGVSFSTQASLCKDTGIELGEGSLRRTWHYLQEFKSVT